MAGKGRAVANVVKWGMKYGPHVAVIAQQAKEPAMAAGQKVVDRQRARRRALEHAATLREGTVLKTFDPRSDSGEPVWVVFAGDEVLAAYPATTTPLPELVAKSDLDTRMRPAEVPLPGDRVRQLVQRVPRGRRRPSP